MKKYSPNGYRVWSEQTSCLAQTVIVNSIYVTWRFAYPHVRICQTKFQLSIHFRSRGYPAPRKTQMPAIEKVLYLYYFFELFVTSLKAELFKPFKPLQRNNLINPYIIRSFRLIRVL